jgi:hypothetical protein
MLPAKISEARGHRHDDQNHNKFSCASALMLLLIIVQQVIEIAGTG